MKEFIIGLIIGLLLTYFLVPEYDIVIFDKNITFIDEKGTTYKYE